MGRGRARDSINAGLFPRATWRTGWRVTLLAVAFAIGITAGRHFSPHLLWWWIVAAAVLLISSMVIARRQATISFIALVSSTLAIGGAWIIVKHERIHRNDLVRWVGSEPQLVRLRGTLASPLMLRDRLSGSLGGFSFHAPATYFRVDVETLLPRRGPAVPVSGQVLVRVNDTMPPARFGDHVELTGTIVAFPPAANPGELDRARYAAALGQAGLVRVAGRESVSITPVVRHALVASFNEWRMHLRHRASGWLKADLPTTERTERDALLAAMFLGERGPDLDGLDEAFKRTGLSHVLAISGLHLGVLAGVMLGVFRFTGRHRAWHAWAVIATILFYLLLIEVRLPVMRAAMMIIIACIGMAMARRFAFSGMIALSGIALLIWRPDQLFEPGFQLSFGVVLGLGHFSAPLREAWWGPRDVLATSASAMAMEWLKDLVAASIVAWLISLPIIIYHFSVVSFMATPASIVAIPIVTMLLAVGYLKMVLGVLLPSAGLILGTALSASAEFLISLVQSFDAIPHTAQPVPGVSAWWAVLAVILMIGWLTTRSRRRAIIMLALTIALSAWALWPRVASDELRMDMLAVGDGSCILIRSGDSAVLFDAGSSTNLNAGRQSIVPALRRLGVRRIDALILSHANLDHYAAAIEVADAFAIGRVLVPPQFLRAADASPNLAVGALVDAFNQRAITIQPVASGHVESFGATDWTWLHPPAEREFARENDASIVIRIDAFGSRVLLTGDVQAESMAMLLEEPEALRAHIAEFPHHGSYHDVAIAFMQTISPDIALQSTGWTRWQGDRWQPHLESLDIARLVTARDGAVWVSIDAEGRFTTGTHRR